MELKEREGCTGCRSPSENTGCWSSKGCAARWLEALERGHGKRDRGGRVSQGRGWEKGWGRERMGGLDKGRPGRSGCLLPSGRSQGAAEVAATSPAAAVPSGSSARGCSAPTGTRAPRRAGSGGGVRWEGPSGRAGARRLMQWAAARRRAHSPAAALCARLSPASLPASPCPSPSPRLRGFSPANHRAAGEVSAVRARLRARLGRKMLQEASTSAPHSSSSFWLRYLSLFWKFTNFPSRAPRHLIPRDVNKGVPRKWLRGQTYIFVKYFIGGCRDAMHASPLTRVALSCPPCRICHFLALRVPKLSGLDTSVEAIQRQPTSNIWILFLICVWLTPVRFFLQLPGSQGLWHQAYSKTTKPED